MTLEDALLKLQAQHQKDLNELEQRLQAFYQAEWDKVHLTYQDEADKCKSLMQQQVCLKMLVKTYCTFSPLKKKTPITYDVMQCLKVPNDQYCCG